METIVRNVLEEIPGVARLTPQKKGLLGLISEDRPRMVTRVGPGRGQLSTCRSSSPYGCRLKTVCAEIQQKVKDAVQDMTGIAVSRVNVPRFGHRIGGRGISSRRMAAGREEKGFKRDEKNQQAPDAGERLYSGL